MKTLVSAMRLDLQARLWHHLTRRRQYQFVLLLGLILVNALTEVISLGAVIPFLGILVAPDRIFSNPIFAEIYRAWGINSADQLVLPLTVAFAMLALLAGAVRIFLLWASNRLAFACGADLGMEVYRRTLYQPYHVHLARNSSEVISGLTTKVNGVVFGALLPCVTLLSSIVLLVAIMIAFIAIDPILATLVGVCFGASYSLITWISRRRLYINSQRIAYEQTQVVKALQEGLGGIRDILLDSTQPVYSNIYRKAEYPLRQALGNNTFIGISPRYFLEAFGMVMIAALAYKLSQQDGGISTALPLLGALALGAQRLLPALQQSYGAWTSIVSNHASLTDVIQLLDQPLPAELLQPAPGALRFQKDIQFRGVRYRYTSEGPWVLNGLNLSISKGERVGFVGSTGSGKSTTLDLLMGLLTPTEGGLLVDGEPISGTRVRAWQQTIAHVPQSIFLADTTLAENIAFGVPAEAINLDRVRKAARQAQIADFIENRPDGYHALVGERGIRLSGGQRQRIGIARALYKEASVLVFDEATSALDNSTEQSVMAAIEGLSSHLTILLIAHRLSTVRRCNTIVELECGQVVAQGTYEQLLKCSPSFRRMAGAS